MILFVDDERRRMDSYVRELELSGFQVSFQCDADSAWSFFEQNVDRIELLILDIMMPSGSFTDEETEKGLRTGLRLYEKIRAKAPDLQVFFFTAVTDPVVRDKLCTERNCRIVNKSEMLPFQLCQAVTKALAKSAGKGMP